jgi:hypothetical protein
MQRGWFDCKNKGKTIEIVGNVEEEKRKVAVIAENKFKFSNITFPHLEFHLRITDYYPSVMLELIKRGRRAEKGVYIYAEVITLPPLEYFEQYEVNPERLKEIIKDEGVVKKLLERWELASVVRFQTMIEPFLNRFMVNVEKKYADIYPLSKREKREKRKRIEELLITSFRDLYKRISRKDKSMVAINALVLNTGEIFNMLLAIHLDILSSEVRKIIENASINRIEKIKGRKVRNEFCEFLLDMGVNIADHIYHWSGLLKNSQKAEEVVV